MQGNNFLTLLTTDYINKPDPDHAIFSLSANTIDRIINAHLATQPNHSGDLPIDLAIRWQRPLILEPLSNLGSPILTATKNLRFINQLTTRDLDSSNLRNIELLTLIICKLVIRELNQYEQMKELIDAEKFPHWLTLPIAIDHPEYFNLFIEKFEKTADKIWLADTCFKYRATKVLKTAIEKNLILFTTDSQKNTLIHSLVLSESYFSEPERIELIKTVFLKKPELLNQKNTLTLSALCVAINLDKRWAVRLLLELGATIEHPEKYLTNSFKKNHKEIYDLILTNLKKKAGSSADQQSLSLVGSSPVSVSKTGFFLSLRINRNL